MEQEQATSSSPRRGFESKLTASLFLTAALILAAGIWAAKEAGARTDLRMRRELIRKAMAVAEAIPAKEATSLSFTPDDLTRPAYQRMCTALRAYAETAELKSVYTMALRDDGQLAFGPESLDPDSPGLVYEQPSPEDFEIFETGEPFAMGPFTDEYGTFVSASAPVANPQTGEIILTLGIDIEAPVWNQTIRKAQCRPILFSLIPTFFLAVGGWLIKLRNLTPQQSQTLLHHTEPLIFLVVMMLVTAGTASLFYTTENTSRTDSFYSTALLKARAYSDDLTCLYDKVQIMATFFNHSESISRDKFNAICSHLMSSHSIKACNWLPKISSDQIDRVERQARADGLTDFTIHDLNRVDSAPDTDTLYPVLYSEPCTKNADLAGFNAYSDPARRIAIDLALESGHATASSITTLPVPGSPPGICIFQPVSMGDQPGVIEIMIQMDILINQVMLQTTANSMGLTATLLELSPGKNPQILARAKDAHLNGKETVTASLHQITPFFLLGKAHAIVITPTKQWIRNHPLRNWKIVLFAGFILSAIITSMVTILTNRPLLLEKRVRQRTKQLKLSEQRLSLATDSAHLGIWEFDLADQQMHWDNRMYSIYELDQPTETSLYDAWKNCVHPEDRKRVLEEIQDAIHAQSALDTELRIVLPSGKIRYILACAKVSRAHDGSPLRMTGVTQDITDRKLAEEQIATQLDELNRWYNATTGRETRILELKAEVNQLLSRSHQPLKYQEVPTDRL